MCIIIDLCPLLLTFLNTGYQLKYYITHFDISISGYIDFMANPNTNLFHTKHYLEEYKFKKTLEHCMVRFITRIDL